MEIKCTTCGEKITRAIKFCPNCGKNIKYWEEDIKNNLNTQEIISLINELINDYDAKLKQENGINDSYDDDTNEKKLGSFNDEINYLNNIKNYIVLDDNFGNKELKIKLDDIINEIFLRRHKYIDINSRLESPSILYDYSNFFDFLDSLIDYQIQSVLFLEEKVLHQKISENKMKFKSLTEKNFSTFVEKIRNSYFNKKFNSIHEINIKIKNLEKIQKRFNITTLLEFTQLKNSIYNELKITNDFFNKYTNWQAKSLDELFDLYEEKISVEIQIQNLRTRYNNILEEKIKIREYIETVLISEIEEIIQNINYSSDYNEKLLIIEQYNNKLNSEDITIAFQNAQIIINSKEEILKYLKYLRTYVNLSVEEKIEIINVEKNLRNLDKFPRYEKEINKIKENIKNELKNNFDQIIKMHEFNIIDSFSKTNPNLNVSSNIMEYIGFSTKTDEKIHSLIELKDKINPLKAKMRVIALQPNSLPKLRSIEKFQSEIIKNLKLDKTLKQNILTYFEKIYYNLLHKFEIKSLDYDIDITNLEKEKFYKIISRVNFLIKIGRKNFPYNDITFSCKKIPKQCLSFDLSKDNIIHYLNKNIANDITIENLVENNKVIKKIIIAKTIEAEIVTLSDILYTFKFNKISCENCTEKDDNCSGCNPEYVNKLRNTTFIFHKEDCSFYIDDNDKIFTTEILKKDKTLKIEINSNKIFVQYPKLNPQKYLIANDANSFFNEYSFKLTTINQKNLLLKTFIF